MQRRDATGDYFLNMFVVFFMKRNKVTRSLKGPFVIFSAPCCLQKELQKLCPSPQKTIWRFKIDKLQL